MKKFIPTILILTIILSGFFGPLGIKNAHAQDPDASALKTSLMDCEVFSATDTDGENFGGCISQYVAYPLLVSIPSFLLGISAKFFDYMALVTLDRAMYDQGFITNIWTTLRNLANIFFILILLYAALQLILGMGGDPKRTVAQVIIIALLINFSLFFTKVIIDASNIMALVFYNNIDTQNVASSRISTKGERDLAGTLVEQFNITRFFDDNTIESAKSHVYNGNLITNPTQKLSFFRGIALMSVYALVILPLIYAFIMAGLSFLGRTLTLLMLMIVAPVAFISYAVPALRSKETIGFDSWLSKLLQSSFMAAIFMFIIYVLAEILKGQPFQDIDGKRGILALMISIFLPAVLMVVMLLKGAKYAKEASGEFTGAVITGVKMVGGLAGGVALGATAAVGTRAVGGAISKIDSKWGEKLRDKTKETGLGGYASRWALNRMDNTTKRTFDLRQTGIGKTLADKAGINVSRNVLGTGVKEGGYQGIIDRKVKQVEENKERYKTKLSDDEVKIRYAGIYNSAEELNRARLKEYQENIGRTGLLYMLAQTGVDKSLPQTEIDKIVNKRKLIIGGVASVLAGGLAGAFVSSVAGAAISPALAATATGLKAGVAAMPAGGGVIAGAVGGAASLGAGAASLGSAVAGSVAGGAIAGGVTAGLAAGSKTMTDNAAWSDAGDNVKKEIEKMDKIQKRLSDLKDTLEKHTKALETEATKGGSLVKETEEKEMGHKVYEVDTKALEDALAKEAVESEDLRDQLSALSQEIERSGGKATGAQEDKRRDLQRQRAEKLVRLGELNNIKSINNGMAQLKKQIYDVGGEKSKAGEKPSPNTP